jgi:hypothetical protein
MNEFVTGRGGWATSLPDATEITVEALPWSTLPDELRDLGFDLQDAGEGERILPAGIEQRLMQNPDGTLGPATAGSTRSVVVIRHAVTCWVKRYTFNIS